MASNSTQATTEDQRRIRQRAYSATLARLVPQVQVPGPLRDFDDNDIVERAVRTGKLIAVAEEDGRAAHELIGDLADPTPVIVDTVMRLYLPEFGVPLSADTFELVRAVVKFTHGWTAGTTVDR